MLLATLLPALLLAPAWIEAAPQEPAELVTETLEHSIAALEARQADIRSNPRVAYELMEEILGPRVDFALMSRLILARHWSEAQPAQREAFVEAFRESLLRTYSRVLSENIDLAVSLVQANEQLVRVRSTEGPDNRGRASVHTLLNFSGVQIPMEFRMHRRDGHWRVFDLVIENVSFVMNYRSEYDAQLQRSTLDELIERLTQRNRRAWQEG